MNGKLLRARCALALEGVWGTHCLSGGIPCRETHPQRVSGENPRRMLRRRPGRREGTITAGELNQEHVDGESDLIRAETNDRTRAETRDLTPGETRDPTRGEMSALTPGVKRATVSATVTSHAGDQMQPAEDSVAAADSDAQAVDLPREPAEQRVVPVDWSATLPQCWER